MKRAIKILMVCVLVIGFSGVAFGQEVEHLGELDCILDQLEADHGNLL